MSDIRRISALMALPAVLLALGLGVLIGRAIDDDPTTEGDAQRCQTLEPEVAVFEPIVGGKIKVKAN